MPPAWICEPRSTHQPAASSQQPKYEIRSTGEEGEPKREKPRGSVYRSIRPLGIPSPTETPRSRRTRSPGKSPIPPLGGTSANSELPHSQSQQCKPTQPPPQPKTLNRFRDHQPRFREPQKQPPAASRRSTGQSPTKNQVPSTKYGQGRRAQREKPRGSVYRSIRPLGIPSPTETPRSRRTRSPGKSPIPPLGGTSANSELPHSQSQQCKPTQPPPQPKTLNRFRDHQPRFREPQKQPPAASRRSTGQSPTKNQDQVPSTKYGQGRRAQTRETPRERLPKYSPSRDSQPKPACAGSSLRSPKAPELRSGPKPVPKIGSSPNRSLVPRPHPHRTEARSERPPLSERNPPLPRRTSHDRPSQPVGLLFRCSKSII